MCRIPKILKSSFGKKLQKGLVNSNITWPRTTYLGGSKMGENPCIAYPNIEQEKWKEFVKYRTSEAFKVYLLYMYSS